MNNKFSGSCLCGHVKFEIEGTFENFFLCHCQFCQKDSGSAHGANLFSTKAHLKWITGSDKVSVFHLPSSRHTKSFCKVCGSALPNQKANDKRLVVPAGSLDTDVEMKPNAHLFYSSRAKWDDELENIKRFETYPKY